VALNLLPTRASIKRALQTVTDQTFVNLFKYLNTLVSKPFHWVHWDLFRSQFGQIPLTYGRTGHKLKQEVRNIEHDLFRNGFHSTRLTSVPMVVSDSCVAFHHKLHKAVFMAISWTTLAREEE
jgi:hypothetical protein